MRSLRDHRSGCALRPVLLVGLTLAWGAPTGVEAQPTSQPPPALEASPYDTTPTDEDGRTEATQRQAISEALFRQAMDEIEAGNSERACELFERSLQLEVAPGTLWHLSQCREQVGQLASAWAAARRLEGISAQRNEPEREAAARARAEALEPRLSRLRVRGEEARTTPDVEVMLDGEPFAGAWNVPIPIDQGRHTVEVTAPLYESWSEAFDVTEEGATVELDVPPLTLAPVVSLEPPMEDLSAPPWYEQPVGWTFAGTALAMVGAAVALLIVTFDLESQAEEPGLDLSDRDSLLSDADLTRALSIAAFSTGGLLAGGAVLSWTQDW